MKVIITGATGMVGEGVLLSCLQNSNVSEVLVVTRKRYELEHPKLRTLIVADFFQISNFSKDISGFDACFFCAGVSSMGMKEDKYTRITYDTTITFAKSLLAVNNNMCFCYVSGIYTDSTEKGRIMWARVKGKTENDLIKLPFRSVYNFRPGGMLPFPGQKNWKSIYKVIVQIIRIFSPKIVLMMQEVGQAMVKVSLIGYPKQVLEIADIKQLAKM